MHGLILIVCKSSKKNILGWNIYLNKTIMIKKIYEWIVCLIEMFAFIQCNLQSFWYMSLVCALSGNRTHNLRVTRVMFD